MSVTKNLRKFIVVRDGYCCRYCGKGESVVGPMEVDHVDTNGPDSWRNLVAACWSCNHKKLDKVLFDPIKASLWRGYDWVIVVSPGRYESYLTPSNSLTDKLRNARCFVSEFDAENWLAEKIMMNVIDREDSVDVMTYREASLKWLRLTLHRKKTHPGIWYGPEGYVLPETLLSVHVS